MAKPIHQRIWRTGGMVVVAFVFVGAILDTINNLQIITTPVAATLTVLMLLSWYLFHRRAVAKGLEWEPIGGGGKTRIRNLRRVWPWIIGVLLVLWISPVSTLLSASQEVSGGQAQPPSKVPLRQIRENASARDSGHQIKRHPSGRSSLPEQGPAFTTPVSTIRSPDEAVNPAIVPVETKDADKDEPALVTVVMPPIYRDQEVVVRAGDFELSGIHTGQDGVLRFSIPVSEGLLEVAVDVINTGETFESQLAWQRADDSTFSGLVDLRALITERHEAKAIGTLFGTNDSQSCPAVFLEGTALSLCRFFGAESFEEGYFVPFGEQPFEDPGRRMLRQGGMLTLYSIEQPPGPILVGWKLATELGEPPFYLFDRILGYRNACSAEKHPLSEPPPFGLHRLINLDDLGMLTKIWDMIGHDAASERLTESPLIYFCQAGEEWYPISGPEPSRLRGVAFLVKSEEHFLNLLFAKSMIEHGGFENSARKAIEDPRFTEFFEALFRQEGDLYVLLETMRLMHWR